MTRYAANTEVSSDRSRAEIERTLTRYGATSFAYGWQDGEAAIGFEMVGRRVRFTLPMPARSEFETTETGRTRRSQSAIDSAFEQAVRQRWRALALVVKAKLEAVESGISEFEDEFLAHIVMPDGRTVAQHVRPGIAYAYEKGSVPALLAGASS